MKIRAQTQYFQQAELALNNSSKQNTWFCKARIVKQDSSQSFAVVRLNLFERLLPFLRAFSLRELHFGKCHVMNSKEIQIQDRNCDTKTLDQRNEVFESLKSGFSTKESKWTQKLLTQFQLGGTSALKDVQEDKVNQYKQVLDRLQDKQIIYGYSQCKNTFRVHLVPFEVKQVPENIIEDFQNDSTYTDSEKAEIGTIIQLINQRKVIGSVKWKGIMKDGKIDQKRTEQILNALVEKKVIWTASVDSIIELYSDPSDLIEPYCADQAYAKAMQSFQENAQEAVMEHRRTNSACPIFSWNAFSSQRESEKFLKTLVKGEIIKEFKHDEKNKNFTIELFS